VVTLGRKGSAFSAARLDCVKTAGFVSKKTRRGEETERGWRTSTEINAEMGRRHPRLLPGKKGLLSAAGRYAKEKAVISARAGQKRGPPKSRRSGNFGNIFRVYEGRI